MSTIITPSEDQINIVITDDAVNVNVTSEPVVVNVTEEIIQISPISGAYPLPSTVYSVFGRTGSVVAQEGDYDLSKLSDVVLLDLANNDVLSYNGTNWVNEPMDLSGYVPYTGATGDVNLGVNNLNLNKVLIEGNGTLGGSVNFKQMVGVRIAGAGYTSIATVGTDGIGIFYGGNGNSITLMNDLLTSSHYYSFPNFSGTIALLEAPQVFTEINSFINNTIFDLEAQFSIGHYLVKGGTPSGFAAGQVNVYSETSTNNIVFRDPSSKAKLVFNNSTQTYTFPNASGTIALTSDIPSSSTFVTLAGAQTITGFKTIANGLSINGQLSLGGLSYGGSISFLQGTPHGFGPLSTIVAFEDENTIKYYIGQGSTNYKYFVFDVSAIDLNATRTYNLPNASGTIALTSDIPSLTGYVPYTGATSDVNIGLNDMYATRFWLYDEVEDGYASIHYADESFHVENSEGQPLLVVEEGFVQLHKTGTIQSNLWTTLLTVTRDHYLPDTSGTIALTSDIPSLTGYVPYTGATGAVNLGANSITAASLIKSGGTSAQILAADGSVITAGTNITISGGTISSSGGGGGGADLGIVYVASLKALNFLSIY